MKYNDYSYSYRLVISNSQIAPINSMYNSIIITYINSVALFINVVVVDLVESIFYANIVNKYLCHGEKSLWFYIILIDK